MRDITANLSYIAIMIVVIVMLLITSENGSTYAYYLIQGALCVICLLLGYIMGLMANYQFPNQSTSKTVLVASESKQNETPKIKKKKLEVKAKLD